MGAGQFNSANGVSSLVIGGFDNHATAIDSLVGAGAGNRATGARSVVVGGGYNLASGQWSFIGGGGRETGAGNAGNAAQDNVSIAKWSSILGGSGNRAGGAAGQAGAIVVGGESNRALNTDATVFGGTLNLASAMYSTVGGGQSNTSSGNGAAVGGGLSNTASGTAANSPGGNANSAIAAYSVAVGQRAKNNATGSFVSADGSAFEFTASANNEFAVRAVGGLRFVTGVDPAGSPVAGVAIAAGSGSWSNLSDRAAKKDLAMVDGVRVLDGLGQFPLYSWRYKTEISNAPHIGPMAQDFRGAFGLGDSDKRIALVDADGVSLAAIKTLRAEVARTNARIAERARRLVALRARLAQLEAASIPIWWSKRR